MTTPTAQPGALERYPPTLTGRFTVALDHFRFSLPAKTFGLRYFGYGAFANGPEAPVLFYCGNEGAIETFYNNSGALFEHADALHAHVFFVEHRFYGRSLPFVGNHSFTPEALQFLSIEQALADYAEVISALPSLLGCQTAIGRCDTVLVGGSYGGMLAAWHRFKFPHLSVGAIASGAPIDFYPGAGVQAAFAAAVIAAYDKYGGHVACADSLKSALRAADNATAAALEGSGVRACAALGSDAAERRGGEAGTRWRVQRRPSARRCV